MSVLAYDNRPITRHGARPNPVYLPFMDVKQEDALSEPQVVRIKSCASGYAYLETIGKPDVNGKFIIGTNSPLTAYINRIFINSVFIYGNIWNINPFSDTIIFIVGVTTYTATAIDGNYTPTNLVGVLVTALNATASGLVFTAVVNPRSPNSWDINATGNFQIIGGTITNRPYLANVQIMSFPAATTTWWEVLGLYTRWIDVNSEVLTSYSKIKNSSTSQISSTNFFRIYLADPNAATTYFLVNPSIAITYLSTLTTTNIDFTLVDEFGTPLYVFPNSNFSLIMNLILEQ